MSGCRVLGVFWTGSERGSVLEVARLLRGRCGSVWMIWSKSCLVRPSDGVVEGPLRGAIELGARGRRSEVLMLWLPLVSSHEAETEADRQPFTPTIMVSIFYQNHQSNNRRHNIYVCRTVVQIKYSIEIPSRQNCKRQLSTRNDRVIHR